jgi:hypothetical protein
MCGLEARTNFVSFKKVTKTRCGLDSRIYGTSKTPLTLYQTMDHTHRERRNRGSPCPQFAACLLEDRP